MRYNNTSVLLRTYRNTGIFLAAFLLVGIGFSQDENPYVTYDVPFQNLLKFNRFLVNPTFSTVREDKSYINFFHRSQAAAFDDNKQDYFLSYSGRINDRIGLGLSIYNQQEGVISNIGAMANYAYGVRLSQKSVLTFGVNIPYYQSTFDERNVITVE
jgi:type IX secretion system PorP/SprF family membrane protein